MYVLYREDAVIGSGSTAAAIRNELLTGLKTKGAFHSQKGKDYIINLEKWLKNNPDALSIDRAAAENVLKDLKNALEGR